MKTITLCTVSLTLMSAIACLSVAARGETAKTITKSAISGDVIAGRISYWQGKVNTHTDPVTSVWQSDSDCTSGAGIDPLTYCKKFYPATTSVTSVPVTTKPALSWNTAGCGSQYSGDGVTEYLCNP